MLCCCLRNCCSPFDSCTYWNLRFQFNFTNSFTVVVGCMHPYKRLKLRFHYKSHISKNFDKRAIAIGSCFRGMVFIVRVPHFPFLIPCKNLHFDVDLENCFFYFDSLQKIFSLLRSNITHNFLLQMNWSRDVRLFCFRINEKLKNVLPWHYCNLSLHQYIGKAH